MISNGPLQVILAGICFAALGAVVKGLSRDLPNEIIVFSRNLFGLLTLLPWLVAHRRSGLGTSQLSFHILRALAGLGAMYCYFFALAHIRLADAVLLSYTLPLFLPIIARVWLKETFSARIWLAILIGFAGVILILKPGSEMWNRYALVGLAAGVLGGFAQVAIRKLIHTEPVTRVVFYFALIAAALSAVPASMAPLTLNRHLWVPLLLLGIFATVGQIFLTRGYAATPAARVGPFIYSAVVFAGLFDWLFWENVPDLYSVLGGLLVVFGGVLSIMLREKER